MSDFKLWLAALAALCLLAQGSAQAFPTAQISAMPASPLIRADQSGQSFHHGRRGREVFCLKQNYWWFYRPYTTAVEDFPRCEPYFHYLEPAYGPRPARSGDYVK
jgi:hypothetical protein